MFLKSYRPLLLVAVIGLVFYIANRLLFLLPQFKAKYENYHYSLEILYLFFTVCSLVIMFILLKVHQKTPDNTGYAFLAATSVKMGLSYFILRPILNASGDTIAFEKGNFFIIFILFLATETIVAIRLLNKSQ